MPLFDKFLGSILLTIACLLVSSDAYPNSVSSESSNASSKHATSNRSHLVAPRNLYSISHPETIFWTFGGPGNTDPPPYLQGLGPTTSLERMAVLIVQSRLRIDARDIHFQSGFKEGPGIFLYVRQSHKRVPFANAAANIALHDNRIVAFGSSFIRISSENIASSTPSLDVRSVIRRAEKVLNGKFNGHATLEYLAIEREWGTFACLTHVVQIRNDRKGIWAEAYMDAHKGNFVAATDFVSRASYKVVPIWERGLRGGQTTLANPQDLSSSPRGWHNNGTTTTESTDGNNVIVFKKKVNSWTRRTKNVTTRESRPGLVFDYTYVDTLDPKIGEINLDAARTNAFYVINTMHDIAYKYGFTEKSFNFQTANFGKGGLGNDRIEVQVHDDSDGGSWSFHTPPDGQSAICRLHGSSRTRRDMAMENSIIVHEFTHGITGRMVGGGSARCLDTQESKGLAEGFSDAMAEWVQQRPIPPGSDLPDYLFGYNSSLTRFREYPYSISKFTNPLRYSSMNKAMRLNATHRVGEIWANVLHNVYAALVKEHGFSENARTHLAIPTGNVIFMHLFIDALSLLPCNPTLLHARDAWIQADHNRNGGANMCLLWGVFASRGLGSAARDVYHAYGDADNVPFDCMPRSPDDDRNWDADSGIGIELFPADMVT